MASSQSDQTKMSTLVVKAREIESEEEIQRIYNWMDDIELSRPRKSISRDFADGLLIAEVICQYNYLQVVRIQFKTSCEDTPPPDII